MGSGRAITVVYWVKMSGNVSPTLYDSLDFVYMSVYHNPYRLFSSHTFD
jgi:hypothetical protein